MADLETRTQSRGQTQTAKVSRCCPVLADRRPGDRDGRRQFSSQQRDTHSWLAEWGGCLDMSPDTVGSEHRGCFIVSCLQPSLVWERGRSSQRGKWEV